MAGGFEIGTDAPRDVGVDGKGVAPTALPDDTQAIESAVLMKILHRKRGEGLPAGLLRELLGPATPQSRLPPEC